MNEEPVYEARLDLLLLFRFKQSLLFLENHGCKIFSIIVLHSSLAKARLNCSFLLLEQGKLLAALLLELLLHAHVIIEVVIVDISNDIFLIGHT